MNLQKKIGWAFYALVIVVIWRSNFSTSSCVVLCGIATLVAIAVVQRSFATFIMWAPGIVAGGVLTYLGFLTSAIVFGGIAYGWDLEAPLLTLQSIYHHHQGIVYAIVMTLGGIMTAALGNQVRSHAVPA